MSSNRLTTILLSATLFLGSDLLSIPSTAISAEPTSTVMKIDSSTNEMLYALHYAIIPGILFSETGSRFFNDLFTGNTAPFREIVEGPLGKEYASGMTFTSVHKNSYDLVLISFPQPRFEALSLHAALVKKDGKYRYITLEDFSDIAKNGSKTILAELTADNSHKNLGAKNYDTKESFLNELDKFLNL
ncbi:MAG: hypothetical protein HGA97_10260 [Chlorobiaceae bacterium]|nr:hypothetical protein [Chlorobiaceae bacterium]